MAAMISEKAELFDLYAQVGKALSSPGRLELLDLLAQAPQTVEELASKSNLSLANTSQHLQRLKNARLVDVEREGTYRRYRLADPAVAHLWHALRSLADQQLAEVERALDAYRRHRHEFARISAQELRERLRTDDVILIDARPREEFQAGHLPGALSVPAGEVEQMLDSLPDDKLVVAYCRGPHCVLADEALEVLAERGRRVARLEEGVVEWHLTGYELEASDVPAAPRHHDIG
jgi:DNA-binding transcriptional ArsR family regulator